MGTPPRRVYMKIDLLNNQSNIILAIRLFSKRSHKWVNFAATLWQ